MRWVAQGLELELRSLPVMQRDIASMRWSVVFQSNVFSCVIIQ